MIAAVVAIAAGAVAGPVTVPPTSSIAAPRMQDGRWAPAVVLLADGRVLVAGGYSYVKKDTVTSVDLFDPATEAFSPAAPLALDRNFATATLLLPSRDVLVAGGFSEHHGGSRGTAEVYDPAANTWTSTRGPMNDRRELFTATRLPDGRVLLAAGLSLHKRGTLATAEVYDPASGLFTPTASGLTDDRFGQAAASLPDGRVLLVGGQSWKIGQPSRTLASAEIYDPWTDRFTLAAPMHFARDRCTATPLPDGRILIAGGTNQGKPPLPAEIFDASTGSFTLAAPLREGRMAHAACALPDGRVVVAGGWADARKATTPTVEVYDPKTDRWSELPDLPFAAHDLALVWLPTYGRSSSFGHVLALAGKSTNGDEAAATSIDRAAWIELPDGPL